MLGVTVDWTQVLIVGVPAYIAAMGAAIAAVVGALNRRALRVPSGGTLGAKVEAAHDTSVANNLLLRAANGETKPAGAGEIKAAESEPPHVPAEQPGPAS